MSEEQAVAAGVQRRSRAEADQLVVEFEASGLGRREFCAQRGVALGTLELYRSMVDGAPGGKILPVAPVGADRVDSLRDTDKGSDPVG